MQLLIQFLLLLIAVLPLIQSVFHSQHRFYPQNNRVRARYNHVGRVKARNDRMMRQNRHARNQFIRHNNHRLDQLEEAEEEELRRQKLQYSKTPTVVSIHVEGHFLCDGEPLGAIKLELYECVGFAQPFESRQYFHSRESQIFRESTASNDCIRIHSLNSKREPLLRPDHGAHERVTIVTKMFQREYSTFMFRFEAIGDSSKIAVAFLFFLSFSEI